MTDAAGSESWAYDLMGRAVKEQRVTNGVTKATTYTYYMDDSVASIVYPSGRTITYGYDAVTRPLSAIDSANSINYVTAALYSPAGGLASLQNGAALISKFFYNKRLQPCRISVKNTGTSPSQCSDAANLGNILDFTYDYNLGTADNGEVKQISNNRNTSRTQNFTYDSLNRILTASTQATTGTYAWGLQFGYDIWGNLLTSSLTQGSAPILTVSADTNNRISGFCYDAAGNLLGQTAPPCPSPTYTYDAENRIKTTAGVTYTYDGDGNRLQKSNGKLYWYGSGSITLDESDAAGNITNEYILFGGNRVARRVVSSGQIQYYFADHLGSSRAVTDASGNILDDADFYPFGGERTYTSTSGNTYKFTGKERDTESGLDDFGARYFTSQFGRFMTPDWSASPVLVPYADLGNPQTSNLYAYVANNPLNTVDPEGHFRLDPGIENYNDPDTGAPLYGKIPTPFAWHQEPDDPNDPKKGTHLAPDKGDKVCNASAGKCYKWDGKKWQPLSADETKIYIVAAQTVKLANGPMNWLIVIGAAEAATITIVEVTPAVTVGVREAQKNLKFDGPSPGFAFANGRAFAVRWGSQGLFRVDLHPMYPGGKPQWHVHLFSSDGEHGLRFPISW
jgi:RHS repeat-associated protein